jgi:hypothetical protein
MSENRLAKRALGNMIRAGMTALLLAGLAGGVAAKDKVKAKDTGRLLKCDLKPQGYYKGTPP